MFREKIGDLEEKILDIAIEMGIKKRPLDLDKLYRVSISKLAHSEENIIRSIKILLEKKYLIEGYELTKANLLDNEKRKQIYIYIKNNPGANNREIRRVFNIGSYDTFRNLEYLEIFGFVRSKKFMNKRVYFTLNTDESNDEKILVLRNERTKLIFDQITNYNKIRLSEIENNTNLNHGQIQPHIKKLLDYNLINLVMENNIKYYIPKTSQQISQTPIKHKDQIRMQELNHKNIEPPSQELMESKLQESTEQIEQPVKEINTTFSENPVEFELKETELISDDEIEYIRSLEKENILELISYYEKDVENFLSPSHPILTGMKQWKLFIEDYAFEKLTIYTAKRLITEIRKWEKELSKHKISL